MSNTPPDNAVEQRRRVLKGALAASGVATMGYSGPALASFQCVTSTEDTVGLDGFKTIIDDSSNWAWLTLQVFDTNKANPDQGNWRAVKIPNGWNPASTDTTTYFFQNSSDNSPPLLLAEQTNVSGIRLQGSGIEGEYAYTITYFDTEGSIVGFFPTHTRLSSDYPAQKSCLTSLNPQMDTTNISYGG